MNNSAPRAGDVLVTIGTRQGAWLFWSDPRRRAWRQRPTHAGQAIHAMSLDGRHGRLYAAVNQRASGGHIERSDDLGRSWQRLGPPAEGHVTEAGASMEVWQVAPGHHQEPDTLWAGLRAASLARSRDGGATWQPVEGLNQHPSRATWMPGGGGLILHTIVVDPGDAARVYVCVSAGGAYRSDDGGASWRPINGGVRADFLAPAGTPPDACTPETGQCVHKLVMHPTRTNVLYQQNHCGVYRSDDHGQHWTDISAGLPSRFGFPIAVHPHEPGTVYVVPLIADVERITPGGRMTVWRSRDGGERWEPLTTGLPDTPRTILRECLATDPTETAGIYVGTTSGQVFFSRDAGDTWELLADGLPPVLSVEATQLAS